MGGLSSTAGLTGLGSLAGLGGLYGGASMLTDPYALGGTSSLSNPFGLQNLYYTITTPGGVQFQIPFLEIASTLGAGSLYNQLFPSLFNPQTSTTSAIGSTYLNPQTTNTSTTGSTYKATTGATGVTII